MSKVDKKKAAEAKDKGNKFFLAKDYTQAIEWYSKAIQFDPTDAAFYSNRAAAYMGKNNFEAALGDADQCIKLMPNWVKVGDRFFFLFLYLLLGFPLLFGWNVWCHVLLLQQAQLTFSFALRRVTTGRVLLWSLCLVTTRLPEPSGGVLNVSLITMI